MDVQPLRVRSSALESSSRLEKYSLSLVPSGPTAFDRPVDLVILVFVLRLGCIVRPMPKIQIFWSHGKQYVLLLLHDPFSDEEDHNEDYNDKHCDYLPL